MTLSTTIPRNELREAVAGIGKVVSAKTTLPVLGCVRFDAGKEGLVAQGTDLDQLVEYRFDGAEVNGDGGCIIPLSTLKDLAKGSKDECVEIETDTPLTISLTNHIGGHAVRQTVAGMDLDEWPAMHVEMQTKPAEGFIDTYRRLMPFSSTDETRYVLNSVFVEVGKGKKPVTMAATDGRRLACFNSMALPLTKSVVVPTTKFLGWAGAGKEVEIGVREDDGRVWLGVRSGQLFYAVKCVDGTYPNYRQVIPGEPGEHVITFADSDVDLLKQVLPSLPGGDEITIVGENGKVTLYGRGPDDERWSTVTPEHAAYKGKRKFIGLDRHYLLDALDAGFREFAITDEFSPLLSRDSNGGTHVLMPMRVSDPEDTGATTQPAAEVVPAVEAAPAVDEPVQPQAADKPTVEPEPRAKKPTTRRKRMTTENEKKNETPALDRVLTACNAAKSKVKEAGQSLTELATAIRDAAREQKVQGKEIESARAALSKLQSISL